MSIKIKSISSLNKLLNAVKSAKNTYKATKLNYFNSSGGDLLSRELFKQGMKKKLFLSGQSLKSAQAVSDSTTINLGLSVKGIKKVRKKIAMSSGGFVFKRIGGRVIPIRIKK